MNFDRKRDPLGLLGLLLVLVGVALFSKPLALILLGTALVRLALVKP